MRVRITLSLGLAVMVVLSVFTLLQFENSSTVTADGTNPEVSNSAFGVKNSVRSTDTLTQGATYAAVVGKDRVQQQPVPVNRASSSKLIYVYPDGSIAAAPGSSPVGSSRYNDDDDQWWGTIFRSNDDGDRDD